MSFKAGDTIGSYRLVAECGKGAYGSVFLAESTVTQRRYALKIIYRQGRNCERELRGLTSYQAICRYTDLLQVYHVEDCGEYFYYTMDAADNLSNGGEYVPDTLANRLRASGRLSAEAVRQMADDLTGCLNTLHARGVLHRDVKPDNILWIDGAAKLGDIGLVTADGKTVLAGTPGFLPPEVLAGTRDYEPCDDFYALGKAIYCALSGKPVEEYPSFPDSRTLGDCGDLILLYNRLCGGETAAALSAPGPRRRRAAWIAAAVLTLVLAVGALYAVLRQPPEAARVTTKPPTAPTSRPEPAAVAPTASADTTVERSVTPQLWEQLAPEMPSPADGVSAVQIARLREVAALLKENEFSPEFLNILPKIVEANRQLDERRNAIRARQGRAAAEKFDAEHRSAPEKRFVRAVVMVREYADAARQVSDEAEDMMFQSFMASLRKELDERKKLETELLKKYRTARDP